MSARPEQRLADLADRLTAIERQLPDARRRRDEWTRGGHRPASIADGPGGTDHQPLPISQVVTDRDHDGNPTRWGTIGPADRTDRQLRHDWTALARTIDRLTAEVARAEALLATFQPAPPTADDHAIPCANPACDQPLDGDRFRGECPRCRKHRSRHRTTWPTTP